MRSWHLNKYCFSFCPNVPIDCAWSRRSGGKLLQILASATAKFRVPSLVFVQVTVRQLNTADRNVVDWPLTTQVHSQRPDMEAPFHADTCRPSLPSCARCAYELEASGVHAGQVWCGHTSWSLSWHELRHSEQHEASFAGRRPHRTVNCYSSQRSCWQTHVHVVSVVSDGLSCRN